MIVILPHQFNEPCVGCISFKKLIICKNLPDLYNDQFAKFAGFEGVQLHLAHGYLRSSFLSLHMNKRLDRWGGTTTNRFRIVREIVKEARKQVCRVTGSGNGCP